MQIQKDTLVTMSVAMYTLQGDLLETADELVYLHGHGDIFPVIEKALEGKAAGEKVKVELEPEEAFGDYDESLLIIRPETDFEEGGIRITASMPKRLFAQALQYACTDTNEYSDLE